MRDDVAELAREGRLVEAAERALTYGDAHDARELFERGCVWGRAAEVALTAGDAGEALRLAALAGEASLAAKALDALARNATQGELVARAEGLRQLGQHAWAARAFEAAGASLEAALAWERAGDPLRAARLLEQGGRGAPPALRVLDAALKRDPDRDDVRVALGALLLRCGKAERALRAVQRVATGSPVQREALEVARAALVELGMNDARAEVEAALALLGPSPMVPPARTGPAVQPSAPRLYGRYEIVREVSSTASARLLECTDTLRGERVALKIFSATGQAARGAGRDALARFTREARVLAELAHPNIVPLREVIEQGPALVLAWMPGGTLEEQLAKETFTPARAALVASAVLQALGEAHRLGVVHRDLKPANILFDASGTARLADFGVAHLGDLSVTATAGVFGSLAYMSPEQREGRPATAASDLFGVGVILLEMLAGTRPVAAPAGPTAVDVGDSLAAVHRHLGPDHDALTRSLVARDPAARPESAFAAARAIAGLAWPADKDPGRNVAPRVIPPSLHPPAERLALPSPFSPVARDLWLDRAVVCVPLTDRTLARAAAFARAADRALQTVLRVDRDAGNVWLDVPTGDALTRPLRPGERDVLARALAGLHAAGMAHGGIDRTTILVGPEGPTLLFATGDNSSATRADDVAALRSL